MSPCCNTFAEGLHIDTSETTQWQIKFRNQGERTASTGAVHTLWMSVVCASDTLPTAPAAALLAAAATKTHPHSTLPLPEHN